MIKSSYISFNAAKWTLFFMLCSLNFDLSFLRTKTNFSAAVFGMLVSLNKLIVSFQTCQEICTTFQKINTLYTLKLTYFFDYLVYFKCTRIVSMVLKQCVFSVKYCQNCKIDRFCGVDLPEIFLNTILLPVKHFKGPFYKHYVHTHKTKENKEITLY